MATRPPRVAQSPSRVRLLGRFTIESDGRAIPDADLGNRKARLLLKLLAARRGRHVSMDTILDVLWGENPPAKAIENVASLVSRLRTAIGTAAVDGGRSGYRLALDPGCVVDIDEAEGLVGEAEGRLESGQPGVAVTAATRAAQILGSAPFEEEPVSGEWMDELARSAARLARRARVAAWRAATAIGEHRLALAHAEDAVAADALDEEAHRAVMRAYYRLGEPGEALASYERLRRVLADELGASPGPQTESLYLSVLRSEPAPDEGAPSVSSVTTSGLVGRNEESAVLSECWETAVRGCASLVLVSGESGIGKTALIEFLAGQVRSTGGTSVTAKCYESEQSLFLQPVVEVLRELMATLAPETTRELVGSWLGPLTALVPELARVVGPVDYERSSPEMERRRTFEAIASFLAALSHQRPLLIVVDDLHHASASTLELLHFLLRWDRTAPLLVASAVQSDQGHEVDKQLGSRATLVRLGPLGPDAVARLADDAGRPDLADELARLTNGHPLFVLEALKTVAGSDAPVVIPESLRDAVTVRIERCGREVEEFLRGAVVAGSTWEIEHVAELLGVSEESAVRCAEAALRSGLLVDAGTGFEFANDVIRKVLYETTPAPTRAVRHRRLAILLARRPAVAAEHAAAAGDWLSAVDHWLTAAEAALASFANAEAERFLTRALDACRLCADPPRTARVHLLRGRALLNQALYERAAADSAVAQTLARAIGDTSFESAALVQLAWCMYYARQVDRANELAERALEHPAAGFDSRILAGRLRTARGDLPAAITALDAVVAETSDPGTKAVAMSYLGTAVAHSDRFRDALETLDEAVDRCRVTGMLRPMQNAMFFAAIARANLGRLASALAIADQLLADVERYEQAAYRPRAYNLLSWLWRELGHPERALEYAQIAAQSTVLPDGYVEVEPAAHACLQLAESALALDDQPGADRALSELSELSPGGASVAFGFRIDLHRLEILSRMDPARSEELLTESIRYGSLKYRCLALGHLGRHVEATEIATATGSDLLLALAGPVVEAERAASRMVGELDEALRGPFMAHGLGHIESLSGGRRPR